MKLDRLALALLLAAAMACGGTDSEPAPLPSPSDVPTPSPSPAPSPSPTSGGPLPGSGAPTAQPTPGPQPSPAPSTNPSPGRGDVRWSAVTAGEVHGVGLDAAGHAFVAVQRSPAGGAAGAAVVQRFAPGGALEWSTDVAPGGAALQLSAMPGGDAVAAVCTQQSCTADDGSARLTIARLTPAGQARWTREVPGDAVFSLDSDVRGRTLVIVGFWDASRTDFTAWHAVILDDAGTQTLDLPLDVLRPSGEFGGPSGDFAVGGQDPATQHPAFERVGSDGTLRWRNVLDTPSGAVDRLAFAEDGTIAMAGWFRVHLGWAGIHHNLQSGATSGFLLTAAGDGSPLWGQDSPEFLNAAPMPGTVRLGNGNEIVVHTNASGKGLSYLRAFDKSGKSLWRYELHGVSGTWLGAVAVGRNGDVVVGAKNGADAPFQALRYGPDAWFVAVLAP